MTLFLTIIGWTIFVIVILAGLALDLLGLFGNWIILGAVGAFWGISGFEQFSLPCLGILALMAILGEIIEVVTAGYGAKRFGGERGSIVSSIVGCIVGGVVFTPIIPIPLLGTLIGACLGAFIGASSYEYLMREKKPNEALWTGLGAAIGKVVGILGKLFIGFAMLIVAAFMY